MIRVGTPAKTAPRSPPPTPSNQRSNHRRYSRLEEDIRPSPAPLGAVTTTPKQIAPTKCPSLHLISSFLQ
jgi:hypothetical protein